jgi:type II secretory ATPase GspE/PulE/Tfp pilus assembly ATPase PilB-like protein
MAQRLVRVICPACKAAYVPDPGELPAGADLKGVRLHRGSGCRDCRNTGYSGRVGIYELLRISPATREMVMARANARQIAESALAAGDLSLLRTSGFRKVRAGQTTVAEVLRATSG